MVIVFDLDDTLYDEIDFVYSGFKEISSYLKCQDCYYYMVEYFNKEGSGKVFDNMIKDFNLDVPISKLISIYRYHKPNIHLDDSSKQLLEFAKDYDTALISDGDYLTQKNKFEALSLDNYIKYPIFTDFYHTNKPKLKAYQMVMDRFKEQSYVYISDNPKKDFIATKKLSWYSIRYKNSVGIYKDIPNSADFEVEDKLDIIDIVKGLV